MKIKSIETIEINSLCYDLEIEDNHNFVVNGIVVHNCKGENITDKIFKVKHIPRTIDVPGTVDIRGELVMLDGDFEDYADKYANPRNFTAGVMGRKEVTDEVSKISFVAYTIFGKKFTKKEQFEILERNGFFTAWHKSFTIAELQIKTAHGFQNFNDELRDYVKQGFPYGVDGLVLSDDDYRNEDVLIPENQVAFKVNESTAETTLIDVQWGEPSKNGRLSPVAILDPCQIAGTVVSRATLNNLDFIEKLGVKYGSKVLISKQGEIIPAIVQVLETPDNAAPIVPPAVCPVCGEELIRDGVDLRCINKSCDAKLLSSVTTFIKKFEIKHSAKKQLDNFNIKTIDDLLAFLPNEAYKSEVTLYNELNEKLFTASPQKIFCAMNFKGLAEVQLGKIIEHYHFDWIMGLRFTEAEKAHMLSSLPSGIGAKSIDTFWESAPEAIKNTQKIVCDSRYNYVTTNEVNTSSTPVESKGSICFTGALETMTRNEAQKKAADAGFEVKGGVTKGLTYLVMADPNSNSSKARKARELGTKCISEAEFLAMCSNEVNSLETL